MCYNLLIFIIFFSCQLHAACQESPVKKLSCGDNVYQNLLPQDSFITQIQQESLQKIEALSKDKEFKDIVAEFQNNASNSQNLSTVSKTEPLGELYIFVSFSLGEKALENLASEAKQFGATLFLKGFKEGSYIKTAQSLQTIITKTGQGVLIDPELYTLFDIRAVPTYILAKPFSLQSQTRLQTPIKWAPLHDKLQGHVSAQYVLESFAKEGDLKREAQTLLKRGVLK